MNERIKKLRKSLELTQAEFGRRIGMKQNTIALIEGGRNTSDQTVFAICREFGVSEQWLRTGEGQMFLPSPENGLDLLAREKSLTHGEYILIQKFLELKPETRRQILAYIQEVAAALPPAPAKPELDIEAEVECYRQELLAQRQAADDSFPSAGSSAG